MLIAKIVILAAILLTGSTHRQESQASTDEPQSQEVQVEDLRSQLSQLEREREQIEARIKELRAQIAAAGDASGHLQAAKELVEGDIYQVGMPIEVGNLEVELVGFDQRSWPWDVKKKIDFEDMGWMSFEFPSYAVVVRVKNNERGRILTPFPEEELFLSKASVNILDNWGNRILQERLNSTEHDIRPRERDGRVLAGTRVLPGKSATFIIPVGAPEVTDVDFFVVRLLFQETSAEGNAEVINVLVPAKDVDNLGQVLK